MAVILLSIKPEYCNKIFDGTKKYEYRRHLPSENVEKIIVYATSPVKKVLGEVEVKGTLSMAPSPLWELTKANAGIVRKRYREYYKGHKNACAYVLGKYGLYEIHKNLSDFGIEQAPQSFVYIHEEKSSMEGK